MYGAQPPLCRIMARRAWPHRHATAHHTMRAGVVRPLRRHVKPGGHRSGQSRARRRGGVPLQIHTAQRTCSRCALASPQMAARTLRSVPFLWAADEVRRQWGHCRLGPARGGFASRGAGHCGDDSLLHGTLGAARILTSHTGSRCQAWMALPLPVSWARFTHGRRTPSGTVLSQRA